VTLSGAYVDRDQSSMKLIRSRANFLQTLFGVADGLRCWFKVCPSQEKIGRLGDLFSCSYREFLAKYDFELPPTVFA
jgi:hypothetical protein